MYLKNKCSHVIATCYRLKYVSFDSVGMNVPIEPNRKKGRPKATAAALQRQQENIQEPIGIVDEEQDGNLLVRRPTQPRINASAAQRSVQALPIDTEDQLSHICPTCGSLMKKKRYIYCPNKCSHN